LAIAKRIFFFVTVNILVLTTITITLNLVSYFFGIRINPNSAMGLIMFCAVFGMGGAFISLLASKFMAKKFMGVKIVDPQSNDHNLRALVETIHGLARKAQLPKMPEVGIYNSPEVNAFATGPSKSNSLVAVSSGLLQRMNREQVEGVLAHEITHVANGDMVTMTLIQGVINTFVMIFARLIAGIIAGQLDDRARPAIEFVLIIVLQIALSILGYLVVAKFSRWREYKADAGGARLAGRENMISALQALAGTQQLVDNRNQNFSSFKISSGRRGGLAFLMSTHPPLEDRIKRLQTATKL